MGIRKVRAGGLCGAGAFSTDCELGVPHPIPYPAPSLLQM